jgi:o-succinylbenzoate---CoA ligase
MITLNNSDHWLFQQSTKQPENTAIITLQTKYSYSDSYEISLKTFEFFSSSGIKKNDTVGIIVEHSFGFYIITNALWFIGAIPVPLNIKNTNDEITRQINQTEIKFIIIEKSLADKYSFNNPEIKLIILPKDFFYQSFDSTPYALRSSLNPLDSSLILFTSGSSGQSKAVVHTFESLFESVKSTDSFSELTKNDIWISSLPLYHIGGFMILIRALLTSSAVAFPPSLKHEEIEKTLFELEPTHVSIVSTTLKKLLDDNITPPKSLQKVYLGGGPLDTDLCREAVSKHWPIIKVYGSSETCSMITALKTEDIYLKPNSVGKPLNRNIIKIINTTADEKSSLNADEIIVKSSSLFKEYYNDPDSTKEKIINGFFHTGDLGWIDREGFLYIESRREDLIISGGENISASEVELLLKSNETIKDAFVFGVPDKLWGQKVCAAVASDNFNEEHFRIFLKDKIAAFKIPKTFFIVKEIPRNEMGKVNRSLLFKQLNLS